MFSKYWRRVAMVPALLSLTGCLAMQQDLVVLQDDIRALSENIASLQRNQADLTVKMDDLSANLTGLDSQIEESKSVMTSLGGRLDDLDFNIKTQFQEMSAKLTKSQAPAKERSPTEIYNDAYKDFSKGQYDLAVSGFQLYLSKNPNGANASKSQYYWAESHYRQERWDSAVDAYDNLLAKYSKSSLVPQAKYKKAMALFKLKKSDESKSLLLSIVKNYPNSEEANAAKRQLESMGVSVPAGKPASKPASKPKEKKSSGK